jgi:aryl-alcohol dehydrogenase-like predicted oxidoreductase
VRVPFDESVLTGKYSAQTKFAEGDFRNNNIAGDRLERAVKRTEKVKQTIGSDEKDLVTAAIKFCLKPDAISTVIPGMRNVQQAEANLAVSDQPPMSDELEKKLREHRWNRAFWYGGK